MGASSSIVRGKHGITRALDRLRRDEIDDGHLEWEAHRPYYRRSAGA